MKKKSFCCFLFAFLMVAFCNPVYTQVIIASDDFENTTIFTPSGTGYVFLSGGSIPPVEPIGQPYFATGGSGFSVTNGVTTLTSNDFNTSSFTNISLQLKVAAFAVNGTAGLDVTDRVRVAVSDNGGVTYTDIVSVTGAASNNSWWAFSGAGVAVGTYPTAVIYNATSSGFNPNGYSTVVINGLPAIANLRISISLNSGSNERWVIDQFMITGTAGVLPLKLTSLNASNTKNVNHLTWTTESEVNTKQFIVEKSKDGVNFTGIAAVAANGYGNGNYRFDDADFLPGKLFYRLKMIDNDGRFTYSGVVILNGYTNSNVTVSPNPVTDFTTITVANNLIKTQAILTDATGKALKQIMLTHTATSINLSAYPGGMYLLKLQNGQVVKLIKE